MKLIHVAALSLALCGTTAMADDCAKPDAPTIPDGATSTMEQMIAGQTAVKSFQAANIEYMGCLDKLISRADKQIKDGTDDDMLDAKKVSEESGEAYNDAVSTEDEVAGQFNTEIREYKAANAK